MNLTPAKTPLVVKKMFPNYVWDIKTNEKELYLTFDDGPTPKITNWVLDILEKYQAKATFFCIGDNIKKHPEVFQNIIKDGHAIGNHTHNHLKGWKTSVDEYVSNINMAQNLINSTYKKQKIFRPPYGKLKPKQANQLIQQGYKIIMWDVLSIDWSKNISPEVCLKNVTTNAKEGSIVVFHDSIKAEKNLKYALPKTLEYFSEKKFVFKSIK